MSPRWLLLIAACLGLGTAEYLLPCYVGRYARKQLFTLNGHAKFDYCTHLILGYEKMIPEHEVYSVFNTEDFQLYDDFKLFKAIHPKVKTILSIGGPQTESWIFRFQFQYRFNHLVDKLINLAKSFDFDGLDVAWFYPSMSDKSAFANFVNALKKRSDGKLIITATVSGDPDIINNNYDVVSFVDSVEFLNVQTFGYHDDKRTTGLNAPLFSSTNDTSGKNVADAMYLWAKLGVPKHKLVMGISAYGQSYFLDDKNDSRIGAPAVVAAPFAFVYPEGVTPHKSVHEILAHSKPIWLDVAEVPILVNDSLWTSYDDPKSIGQKIKFVKQNGFGGAFHNALEYDYPWINTGFESDIDETFDLLSAMKESFETDFPTEAPPVTEAPTITPMTTMDPSLNPCTRNTEYYWIPDLQKCENYYFCNGTIPYHLSCREGLYFSVVPFNSCSYYNSIYCDNINPLVGKHSSFLSSTLDSY